MCPGFSGSAVPGYPDKTRKGKLQACKLVKQSYEDPKLTTELDGIPWTNYRYFWFNLMGQKKRWHDEQRDLSSTVEPRYFELG